MTPFNTTGAIAGTVMKGEKRLTFLSNKELKIGSTHSINDVQFKIERCYQLVPSRICTSGKALLKYDCRLLG